MRITNTLITLTALLFVQCKTNNVGQGTNEVSEVTPIVLLLEEGVAPTDLESLSAIRLESAKRTSRSQNLWMVKVNQRTDQVEQLLSDLKKDTRVLKAALEDASKNTDSFKNSKSGKSGPIKN